ncbi:MAG: glycoside hydrolase family 88 protein [Gorillibacterium sp.]|nr:glycoside hydrolase family 88 protein [Gorillibacterium sp.]
MKSAYKGIFRVKAGQVALESSKRIPQGWTAVAVAPGQEPVELFWLSESVKGQARLRITVALDVREEKVIEVKLKLTGETLGYLDIRYANVFQTHELIFAKAQVQMAIDGGVTLRLIKGEHPLWFFTSATPALTERGQLLLPHLLLEEKLTEEPLEQFHKTLASISSIHPFGWMEGCVLDGLLDLADATENETYRRAATEHLAVFMDESGQLSYENPRSEPVLNRVYGMEGTLPFAGIARLWGNHPLLELALNFWKEEQDEHGNILDGNMLTAEGSYTVAYPMALISNLYGGAWRKAALQQLQVRADKLLVGGQLYLRLELDGGMTFKNWSRAHAWYLLGLVRTLEVLGKAEDTRPHEGELCRAIDAALSWQREGGLWGVFLDEPFTGSDTSGSAGIAAAIAIAVAGGWYQMKDTSCLVRAKVALIRYLVPDGVLSGVAQGNKGGVELQKADYRVLSQMGMGLLGQFLAALHRLGL